MLQYSERTCAVSTAQSSTTAFHTLRRSIDPLDQDVEPLKALVVQEDQSCSLGSFLTRLSSFHPLAVPRAAPRAPGKRHSICPGLDCQSANTPVRSTAQLTKAMLPSHAMPPMKQKASFANHSEQASWPTIPGVICVTGTTRHQPPQK